MCVMDNMAVACDVADVSASRTPYVFNPLRHSGYQGCINPGRRGSWATKIVCWRLTYVVVMKLSQSDYAAVFMYNATSLSILFPGAS